MVGNLTLVLEARSVAVCSSFFTSYKPNTIAENFCCLLFDYIPGNKHVHFFFCYFPILVHFRIDLTPEFVKARGSSNCAANERENLPMYLGLGASSSLLLLPKTA